MQLAFLPPAFFLMVAIPKNAKILPIMLATHVQNVLAVADTMMVLDFKRTAPFVS